MYIGSIFGLVIVYFVRFFALSSNGIKSGYLKINKSMDESAYLLGYSKFKTITRLSEQDDEMKKNINQIKSLLIEQ